MERGNERACEIRGGRVDDKRRMWGEKSKVRGSKVVA